MNPYKYTKNFNLKESDLIFKTTEARDRLNIKERFFLWYIQFNKMKKKSSKIIYYGQNNYC